MRLTRYPKQVPIQIGLFRPRISLIPLHNGMVMQLGMTKLAERQIERLNPFFHFYTLHVVCLSLPVPPLILKFIVPSSNAHAPQNELLFRAHVTVLEGNRRIGTRRMRPFRFRGRGMCV